MKVLRDADGGSCIEIKGAAELGSPVAVYDLFYNNHDEVAEALRKILDYFQDRLTYYELLDDEEFEFAEHDRLHVRKAYIVKDILRSHDETLRGMRGY